MKSPVVFAVAALLAAATPALAAEPDTQALVDEAKGVMKQFGGALKGELQTAMKAGGPVAAIEVCNTRAMPLAEKVSAESGWDVARSSHKLRNPANAPDAFEQAIIDDFLARQAKGEKAADMAVAKVVDGADGKEFRFVKAIGTEEVCLTCHGSEIPAEVDAKLSALYPQDTARGFSAGEMRGVFTLRKKL